MGNFHAISNGHINHVNKDSGEDTMVAPLLLLKAQELSGQIEHQRFRVESMHVIWCSQQAGNADSVAHRVNTEIAKIQAGCKE